MKFLEKSGDATCFDTKENTAYYVPHICNTDGIAGSGFIIAVKNKFPRAIQEYERWHKLSRPGSNLEEWDTLVGLAPKILGAGNWDFQLGNIQAIHTGNRVYIVNMLAQKSFGYLNLPPGRYDCLEECLLKLRTLCEFSLKQATKVEIHAPKFGSLRSGLDWDCIYSMIKRIFGDTEGIWTTYSYEEKSELPSYYKRS